MIEIDSAFSYKDMLKCYWFRNWWITAQFDDAQSRRASEKLASDEYEFTVDDGIVARKLKITQFTLMKLLDWAYLLN